MELQKYERDLYEIQEEVKRLIVRVLKLPLMVYTQNLLKLC